MNCMICLFVLKARFLEGKKLQYREETDTFVNHGIRNVTVGSRMHCVGVCRHEEGCFSTSYNEQTGICQLNEKGMNTHKNEIVTSPINGWNTYSGMFTSPNSSAFNCLFIFLFVQFTFFIFHLFIYLLYLLYSFIYLFTYFFICLVIYSFFLSFIHSFIYSFIQYRIYLFNDLLICLLFFLFYYLFSIVSIYLMI